MGYYINHISTGKALHAIGKADALIADGAVEVSGDEFVPNMICVVDNGIFEAAAYAYDEDEYNVFKRPDGRPKQWLTHPQAKLLSGCCDEISDGD